MSHDTPSREKNAFGQTISKLRENKGLSLNKTAPLLGISPSVLSKFERGKAFPGDELMERIAAFFGVPLLVLQADQASDRGRIEVPDGVSSERIRAAVFGLAADAGMEIPDSSPPDPHSFHCPRCGAGLVCSEDRSPS